MSIKKTIFMGPDAFDKLKKHLSILYPCNEVKHEGVTYRLNWMLEPLQCVTMDKDITQILKELDEKS